VSLPMQRLTDDLERHDAGYPEPTCNLCVADPARVNWMVSQAQDPDMVSGYSIMLYIPPQSAALSTIYFHKVLAH